MNKFFLKNKSLLITGGTGSLGNKLTEILLKDFSLKKLIIFSRDELKQFDHKKKFEKFDKKNICRYFLGDVRDLERLKFAFKDVDFIIHAAALKHVDQAEYNPYEFINTNINGAKNVIEASLYNNVSKVVALSTDKAANPINLYGATKLASDKLFVSGNNITGNSKTRFSVARYGNVINSRGSVAPFFLDLVKNKKKFIPITHKKMTRFWITLKESSDFIFMCFNEMKGGEIFIPKIPSIKIIDLAKAIAPKIPIKIIGLRAGEKIKEILCSQDEYINTIEFKKYFIIRPSIKVIDSHVNYKINKRGERGKLVKENYEYNSENNHKFLNVKSISILLKKEL
jgi:UDP-N-acetylglucosamine 4,6-dehydratase/5-epimerase